LTLVRLNIPAVAVLVANNKEQEEEEEEVLEL
jgi:hypothetical protein